VDDKNRTISQRPVITLSDFRQEGEEAARRLERLLDPLPDQTVTM